MSLDGEVLGIVGRLHPKLARQLDLPKPLFLADLKLDPLLRGQVTAFSDFALPKVVRDLAIVVDEMVKWQQIVDAVATLSDDRIQSVELFDVIVDRVSRTGGRVWHSRSACRTRMERLTIKRFRN